MSLTYKVFGIGLSKTGTTSLNKALCILGINAIHWPQTLSAIDLHEAATDITVSVMFEYLDKNNPGAKFIYTVRERESWLRSSKKHIEAADWTRLCHSELPRRAITALFSTTYNRDLLCNIYDRHDASVRKHFTDRPGKLLVMNICGGDGWDKLCPFLGLPVPNVKFPVENRG